MAALVKVQFLAAVAAVTEYILTLVAKPMGYTRYP